jgi:membrane protease YdiL (CAAX protease family)
MSADLTSTEAAPHSPTFTPIGWWQLLVAPVVGLVIGGLLVVALSVVLMLAAVHGGAFRSDTAFSALKDSFFANMAIIAALYSPLIALLWHAATRLAPKPSVRFFAPLPGLTLVMALATGVVASVACLALEQVLSSVAGISFDLTDTERAMFPTTSTELAVGVAIVGFLGPFAEEVYFRGFLLQWLRQKMNVWPAIVLSAAVFAGAHFFMLVHPGASGWVTTGEIFAVGTVMGVWAARTGSLWSSYAVHIGYNCVAVAQLYLSPG